MAGVRAAVSALAVAALAAGGAFLFLTAPDRLDAAVLAGITGDAERGRSVFAIGGCASCHAAKGAQGDARRVLLGGHRFETPFGVFVAPNISPDPDEGIGAWSDIDFANAMMRGVAPDGSHYYPAFPYTSYVRMTPGDVQDLWAYIRTLPPSDRANDPHELGFPFNVRRGLGLWKKLYVDPAPVVRVDAGLARGQYLVEGPGHCGECHTPRDPFGGPDMARWLAGGPNPDGPGSIPNITPGSASLSAWSAFDIAYYLESGFTPDYDSAGGSMADVVVNTAQLPPEDREAIAQYLLGIPAVSDEP